MRNFKYLAAIFLATIAFTVGAQAQEAQKRAKIELNEDNAIFFGESFNWTSVAKLQAAIAERNERLPSHKPLYIIIDSGGGGISAGLELITNVKAYKRKIHTITLFGASMAFQTVQGLGKRYVTSSGTLMSHKARGGFQGEFPGQLDSRYNFWLRKITMLDQITVDRSDNKLTLESYRDLYENEYWCDGQDCVDQGVADSVADVTCDESLSGVVEEKLVRFFMGSRVVITVKKSACPLVTGMLGYRVNVDGKNFLNPKTSWRDPKTDAVIRARTTTIWNFIQKQLEKPTLPDRVIYMRVPARTDEKTVEPQLGLQ